MKKRKVKKDMEGKEGYRFLTQNQIDTINQRESIKRIRSEEAKYNQALKEEKFNKHKIINAFANKPMFKGEIGFKPGKKVRVSAQGGINALRGLI